MENIIAGRAIDCFIKNIPGLTPVRNWVVNYSEEIDERIDREKFFKRCANIKLDNNVAANLYQHTKICKDNISKRTYDSGRYVYLVFKQISKDSDFIVEENDDNFYTLIENIWDENMEQRNDPTSNGQITNDIHDKTKNYIHMLIHGYITDTTNISYNIRQTHNIITHERVVGGSFIDSIKNIFFFKISTPFFKWVVPEKQIEHYSNYNQTYKDKIVLKDGILKPALRTAYHSHLYQKHDDVVYVAIMFDTEKVLSWNDPNTWKNN